MKKNKKKYQKEQVTKTAKVYTEQLLNEVNDERAKLGKKAVKTEDDDGNDPPAGGGTVERTVSTTDPECGMFVKGEHEKQFAYEAHTACDKKGYVLGVEVTAGNIHDSIAFDPLYEQVTARFPQAAYFAMDSAYKTPWIAKRIIDDGRVPVLPYKSQGYKPGRYKPWEYRYHAEDDQYTFTDFEFVIRLIIDYRNCCTTKSTVYRTFHLDSCTNSCLSFDII